jgi:hypothetical protein
MPGERYCAGVAMDYNAGMLMDGIWSTGILSK